jgi:signal transduction histidine kinase
LFAQKLERAYTDISILVEEQIDNDPVLSPSQALHLFRIMQEALNNALRHSKCSNVVIHIFSDASRMQICIIDDGIGFQDAMPHGNGINNLKMRAKESGWLALWTANEAGGTSVTISSA